MPEQISSSEGENPEESILVQVEELCKWIIDGCLGSDIELPLVDRHVPKIMITTPTLGFLSAKIGEMTIEGAEGKWNGLVVGSIVGISIPFIQWYSSEIAPTISDELMRMSKFILNLPKTVFNSFNSDK